MTRRKKPQRAAMPEYARRCHERGPQALIEVLLNYGLIPDQVGEIRHLSLRPPS
jgi:hypothetical protein